MSAEPRQRPWRGRWPGVLVAMTVALALSSVMDGVRSTGPNPSLAAAVLRSGEEVACDRWALLAGNGQTRGTSVSLFTNGLAVLHACDPNARELQLRGTTAAGSGTFAVLLDDTGVTFAGMLTGETWVTVRGDVRLYFTNDLATASEDRNLHAAVR